MFDKFILSACYVGMYNNIYVQNGSYTASMNIDTGHGWLWVGPETEQLWDKPVYTVDYWLHVYRH